MYQNGLLSRSTVTGSMQVQVLSCPPKENMYIPKTSHQLAKELLALPDLPVECCAADYGGYDVTDHGVVVKFELVDNEYIYIHSEELPNTAMVECKVDKYRSEYVPKYRKQTMLNKINSGFYNG